MCACVYGYIFPGSQRQFYRYQKQARANVEAKEHGNTGLAKIKKHTKLATMI